MLDLVGLEAHLAGADLVITGEGSLDEQSLGGKAPVGGRPARRRHGVGVMAVSGRCTLTAEQLRAQDSSPASHWPIATLSGASPTPRPC